jgi:CheY-like chemotaxis protein
MNQTLALAMLTRLGCQAIAVNSGPEALHALDNLGVDAILMDCEMPGMDGFEATAEIRRREGSGKRIPIIAMTAQEGEEVRERCVAAGMDDYVAKPIGLSNLKAVLLRWVPQMGFLLAPGPGQDPSEGARPQG